ncbi:MAG TPA: response regulator [Candidatus Sulfotelmatobacter sp.]|nr:response regulator [Candidatus Sulfotelmatobacter sp.]
MTPGANQFPSSNNDEGSNLRTISPQSRPPAPSKRKRILVVDDNKVILKAMAFKLKSSGYDVLMAEDGSEAVSTARQQKPDLILLDINFPPDVAHGGGVPWDGFLIMDWLRRLKEAQEIPVIIVTGGEAATYKERALAAGAVGFFQKPVKPEELLAAIRQALGETAGAIPPSA